MSACILHAHGQIYNLEMRPQNAVQGIRPDFGGKEVYDMLVKIDARIAAMETRMEEGMEKMDRLVEIEQERLTRSSEEAKTKKSPCRFGSI